MNPQCPICESTLDEIGINSGEPRAKDYRCPKCGHFSLPGTLVSTVRSVLDTPAKRAILSHAVRRMQKHKDWPFLTSDMVRNVLASNSVPKPHDQANNLIVWIGDNLTGPGERVTISPEKHQSITGAISAAGFGFVVDYMFDHALIEGDKTEDRGVLHEAEITLTFDGWDRYESIKRGTMDTRKAFMAMKFGDPKLDEVYFRCFKPAVEQTGFYLGRIDEQPKAGSIDNRLRVDILTARFVLVDLTHGNRGAYWEAGFAEGLGKPVIYTCEYNFFHRKDPYEESGGIHFDTNHQLIIVWDKNALQEAAEMLKATIRATIPEDAKLKDE